MSCAKRFAAVAVPIAIAATALFALRGCSAAEGERAGPASATAVLNEEVPKFAQRQQALSYFRATTTGDHRSIEAIDSALTEARSQAEPNPVFIEQLAEDKRVRPARLAEHQQAAAAVQP